LILKSKKYCSAKNREFKRVQWYTCDTFLVGQTFLSSCYNYEKLFKDPVFPECSNLIFTFQMHSLKCLPSERQRLCFSKVLSKVKAIVGISYHAILLQTLFMSRLCHLDMILKAVRSENGCEGSAGRVQIQTHTHKALSLGGKETWEM